MLTQGGPRVLEYNCRFGDPETQVVLPLLEGDLLTLLRAAADGGLKDCAANQKPGSAACVILASGGYPLQYEKGYEILGLNDKGQKDGISVYHAGTLRENDRYVTAGGRVLGIGATAPTLREALEKCYNAVKQISFTKSFYRMDIGEKFK
jgi:phosphoribosylamine--glycine ligase